MVELDPILQHPLANNVQVLNTQKVEVLEPKL